MTPNFRLRPKPVHAVQFDPGALPLPGRVYAFGDYHIYVEGSGVFYRIRPGDWLVTDEMGTRIVRHEAFDLMYEAVPPFWYAEDTEEVDQ